MRRMREAPVRGLILRLALPTVASMLVTAFYNLADAWFVGLLDTQSVAAVGVAFPAMAVIQAVGFFFGHGSGNTLARMLGAGDRHGARRMAAVGVVCSVLAGCALAAAGRFYLPDCQDTHMLLQQAVLRLGLNKIRPFHLRERILEYRLQEELQQGK